MYLKSNDIVYIVVEALCGTLGLIGNFLVILVFIRRSVQKPPAVILILSIALGDFAYSLFTAPMQATGQAHTTIVQTHMNPSDFYRQVKIDS